MAPNARCLDGTVAEDIRFSHASYGLLSGGLLATLHIGRIPPFQALSSPFRIVLVLVVVVLVLEIPATQLSACIASCRVAAPEPGEEPLYHVPIPKPYLSQTANPRPENSINKRLPGTAARVAFTQGLRRICLRWASPWGKSCAENFPRAACCQPIELPPNPASSVRPPFSNALSTPDISSAKFSSPHCPNLHSSFVVSTNVRHP